MPGHVDLSGMNRAAKTKLRRQISAGFDLLRKERLNDIAGVRAKPLRADQEIAVAFFSRVKNLCPLEPCRVIGYKPKIHLLGPLRS